MATISRWIVPCYFTKENHKEESIVFDLTNHLKEMLINQVGNRKLDKGNNFRLKEFEPEKVKKATIKILPRAYGNENRIIKFIEDNCGKLPNHLKINSFKKWSPHIGCIIIEIEYTTSIKNIPTRKDLIEDVIPHIDMDFVVEYKNLLAVVKELSSFFLAGLHLSFPTKSFMKHDQESINDGYFQILSKRKTYADKVSSNAFMHEVLIETTKIKNIELNLEVLASVWHYNLWPVHRYLKAVESDMISMDNLLDLIYALEGLFKHNTSSEFIKTMCLINICENKKEAKRMKELLDVAFKIRNEIAHGGKVYLSYDKEKLQGKEVSVEIVYWKMKQITAVMIIKAISKLKNEKGIVKQLYTTDDFINLVFKK